ncbi:hypothetical protein SprV_0301262300 [Sparganum proliferum]
MLFRDEFSSVMVKFGSPDRLTQITRVTDNGTVSEACTVTNSTKLPIFPAMLMGAYRVERWLIYTDYRADEKPINLRRRPPRPTVRERMRLDTQRCGLATGCGYTHLRVLQFRPDHQHEEEGAQAPANAKC